MKRLIALLGALCLLSACGPTSAPEPTVRVFAASSLTDALTAASEAYAAAGNERPLLTFAASSTLARQIEQGAAADVFISADEKWMDHLEERGLIVAESRAALLSNTLVLVAPVDRTIDVAIGPGFPLRAALGGGRLALADPESVPAGRYARAALQSLGVWDNVAGAVVMAEDVRAALRLASAGEAAAAIVYGTDARAADNTIQLVGVFPAGSHPPIVYPAALVTDARAEAREFLTLLRSERGQAIFKTYGFGAPPAR